jgi:hypothetical protein
VTPFLFVGNNRYQTAGLEIGTRSRLDSGQLWVCTAPRTNRQNFMQLALKTLVGRDTDQDLSAFESKEILVQPGSTCPPPCTPTVARNQVWVAYRFQNQKFGNGCCRQTKTASHVLTLRLGPRAASSEDGNIAA